MEVSDVVMIIGAVGGLAGLKEFIAWWRTRRSAVRKEDAAADKAVEDNFRKQIDWMEARLTERDKKIDAIYIEFRDEQKKNLELREEKQQLELELKQQIHQLELELAIYRCEKLSCDAREPSRVCLMKVLTGKKSDEKVEG